MIRILAITGESFDLETGKEERRGIVISNGISVKTIPLDNDEALRTIIDLFVEKSRLAAVQNKLSSVAETLTTDRPVNSSVPNADKLAKKESSEDAVHKYDEAITGVGSI